MDLTLRSKIRIVFIAFAIFFMFAVICIQLWSIQVRSGDEIQARISRQYVRYIRIPAVRGRIFSSDGVMLAGNTASYEIVFHISEMRRPGARRHTVNYVFAEAERLAALLGRENPLNKDKILRHMIRYPGLPVTVLKDISPVELAKAYEIFPAIPGMEIVTTPLRTYPEGRTAGLLIGYVGRDDPRSAEDLSNYSYYIPDMIGRSGLERAYDTWDIPVRNPKTAPAEKSPDLPKEKRALLRGVPGKELVVVDTLGFVRETVGTGMPAENGKDIILTLNCKAQKIAEDLLSGLSGALVLLDASNGKILAMASSPSYDPSLFVPRILKTDYDALRNAPGRPLFNKATLGMYAPGSIIKPLVAISLLENGYSPDRTVYCDGLTRIGPDAIRCWIKADGHGEVTLNDALAVSCNDFFVESGLSLGLERLAASYASAGIGSPTGFILPEGKGCLPDRKHKKKWTAFDTALISIGQGDVLVTPLQAALFAAAYSNGGILWKPLILNEILDSKGMVIYRENPVVRGRLAASPQTLDMVKNGMYLSVYGDLGGSRRARNNAIRLYGKTGTAEVGPRTRRYKNTWFTGYGTREGTTYAIAILVESGISGGKTCAPLAARFFERFFE